MSAAISLRERRLHQRAYNVGIRRTGHLRTAVIAEPGGTLGKRLAAAMVAKEIEKALFEPKTRERRQYFMLLMRVNFGGVDARKIRAHARAQYQNFRGLMRDELGTRGMERYRIPDRIIFTDRRACAAKKRFGSVGAVDFKGEVRACEMRQKSKIMQCRGDEGRFGIVVNAAPNRMDGAEQITANAMVEEEFGRRCA